VDIAELNDLSEQAFVDAVAPWFEGAPSFLARLAAARPFPSVDRMFDTAQTIALHLMPEEDQVELINAHPRLGAPPATVSSASFEEQGYDRDTTDAISELARLNVDYEARFGFRFCVFVNGRSRRELVPVLETALAADREAELRRAINDVILIARVRAGADIRSTDARVRSPAS